MCILFQEDKNDYSHLALGVEIDEFSYVVNWYMSKRWLHSEEIFQQNKTRERERDKWDLTNPPHHHYILI